MKKRQYIFLLVTIMIGNISFSQEGSEKLFQISPYLGLSSPQGDFKDLSDNGSVFGFSVDKYLSSKFALGLDINFQSNEFINPFDYSAIPSAYSVVSNDANKWKATTITFGPTYRLGGKKIGAELYLKGGLSMIKAPTQKATFTSTGIPDINVLELKDENKSSFGLTSGIRLNYSISDKLSLFFNPQYVFSGSEIEFFHRDISTDGLTNPDLLAQDGRTLCYVKPSYLNINAGITFNLVGGTSKDDIPNMNLNPQFCDVIYDGFTCFGSSATLNFTTTWMSHNPNSIIQVEVYQAGVLIASGNQVTNNNQTLGSSNGTLSHSITNGSLSPGSPMMIKIDILDSNGNKVGLGCANDDFFAPNCDEVSNPCDFEIDTTNFSCDMNSVTFNATSSWTNVLAGTTIDIVGYQGVSNVPLTFSPNNIPLTLSGTGIVSGSTNHSITISNSYVGQSITIVMKMTDPTTGLVTTCGGFDLEIPPCTEPICDLIEIEGSCRNGQPYMEFSVDWANYTNFNIYSIYLDAVDQNGNPVAWFNNAFPPSVLNATFGSQLFNMNLLPQYAGQTITITSKICETASNGVKHCCIKVIKIKIPECCENCDNISIIDNTNPNQKGEGFFRSLWTISNITSTPINKISLVLESFGANNSTSTQVIPQPNFEIQGAGIISPTIPYTSNAIGSLNGKRSNFWIIEFPPTNPFTGGDLVTMIEKYDRKILRNYRIRATLYKTDGTRCVLYLYFNN